MEEQKVQVTKRTIRLRRWKVEVLGDIGTAKYEYIVIAAAPMDARIMAFALDGGFPSGCREMKEDDLALVESYTKILEASGG